MQLNGKKIGVISLGCDKNRVDTEKMLTIVNSKFQLTNDISNAEIIIINTCAFLESSRKEAIETIFECNDYRENGKLEKLVVTGCLPERFIDDIYDELLEVDVFLGFLDYDILIESLEKAYLGERVNNVKKKSDFKTTNRVVTTPLHYAYLKIADGCDNHCTYCLIPSIRGRYKSTPIEDLLTEVENLGHVSELILVAQDTTRYGFDLYGKPSLVKLIQEISKLDNVESIRLLYCYPDHLNEELINELATNEKLLKYIDIPLQHADDKILKLMNRKGSFESYLNLVNTLKAKVEGIAIRSTFITGFPNEGEQEFERLKEFLTKAKLLNAGFFAYSKEEGTPSYKLKNHLDEDVKLARQKELYSLQEKVANNELNKFVGKTIKVLCDGIDYDKELFVGRAYFNAPDIDGKIYFKSNNLVEQGNYYSVKIETAKDFDLYGEEDYEFTK